MADDSKNDDDLIDIDVRELGQMLSEQLYLFRLRIEELHDKTFASILLGVALDRVFKAADSHEDALGFIGDAVYTSITADTGMSMEELKKQALETIRERWGDVIKSTTH